MKTKKKLTVTQLQHQPLGDMIVDGTLMVLLVIALTACLWSSIFE